jgi:hypothetical protein
VRTATLSTLRTARRTGGPARNAPPPVAFILLALITVALAGAASVVLLAPGGSESGTSLNRASVSWPPDGAEVRRAPGDRVRAPERRSEQQREAARPPAPVAAPVDYAAPAPPDPVADEAPVAVPPAAAPPVAVPPAATPPAAEELPTDAPEGSDGEPDPPPEARAPAPIEDDRLLEPPPAASAPEEPPAPPAGEPLPAQPAEPDGSDDGPAPAP